MWTIRPNLILNKSTSREIFSANYVELENGYADVEVELDGALYKMVRNVRSPRPAKRRRKGGRWRGGRAEARCRALICVLRASAAANLSY
jgi:hypothetical protein